VIKGINDLVDAFVRPINVTAEYIDRISKGDIPPKITDSYNGDFNEIKNNLNNAIDAVKRAGGRCGHAREGGRGSKLATRADASKHQGDYQKIVKGVNDTLDAVIGPLNVAAEYVDRISKGNIPPKITDTYKGDFNEIKNNLNNAIDAVTGWWPTRHARAGRCGGQARHPGRRLQTPGRLPEDRQRRQRHLDAVIGPLNVAAEYVDRISKGNIPPKITDAYKGDFNEIKNNLNVLIDVANSMLKEADILVEASKEGKLDTRGNAEQFSGSWRELYNGINRILDAILIPIGEGNRILDQVSRARSTS